MNDGDPPAGPPQVPAGQAPPPLEQPVLPAPPAPQQQPPLQPIVQLLPPPPQQNPPVANLQPPPQQPGVQFNPQVQAFPAMAPPQPQGPQAPTVCRTYVDYYADVSKDPFQGQYAASMSDWDVPNAGQARFGEQNLSNRVQDASPRDVAYGVIILAKPVNAPAADPGRFLPVHRITRMPVTLVGDGGHWDGQVFGILDDVIGQSFVIVPLETRWFQRVAGTTTVPTDLFLDQLLAGQPNDQLVGPFAVNDANTEQVGTRHCMFVPFQLMPIFMATKLTPRQAWLRVSAFARANQLVDACRPLLNFLKVAITSPANNTASVVSHTYPMLAQPQDAILVNFFKPMVERDLPHWNPLPSAQHASAQLIAQSISGLTDEQRLSRQLDQQKQAQREAGGTPQQLFGDAGLRKLMRLCQVNDAAFLPPIYDELAKVARSHRHGEIQAAIFQAKEALNVQHEILLSPAVADKLLALQWSSPDPDDMEYAINPALLGQSTPDQERHLLEAIRLREWMQLGVAAPSVADVRNIITPATVHFPRDLLGLQYSMTSFRVLTHVFLGPQHPITQAFYEATLDIAQHLHDWAFHKAFDLPSHVIRFYQRTLNFWAANQVRKDSIEPWPGVRPLQEFAKGQHFWFVPIPERYRAAPPPHMPQQHASNPSGPQAATPATPAKEPKSDTMVRRDKPVDPRFKEIAALGIPPKVIKKRMYANKTPFPKDSQGVDRCFNWSLNGYCNARCTQAADHHTNHSEADQVTFLDWLRANYKTE